MIIGLYAKENPRKRPRIRDMSKQAKTIQRNKAKENNSRMQTHSVRPKDTTNIESDKDISDPISEIKEIATNRNTIKMAEIQEKNLIDKMTKIMKVALNEALDDMKKLKSLELR